MSRLLHHPNDSLFKLTLKQLPVAKEFFARYLPQDLQKQIDLSTLKLEEGSFVDAAYKASEADLLYSIQLTGAQAYLYVLFEQQTKSPQDMAFRLEAYKVHITKQHSQQYPKAPLPVIFPMVLYTGTVPWTAAKEIFPLYGEQEDLARHLASQPYTVIDVCRMADNVLLQDQLAGLVQFVFKYRNRQRDFAHLIETVIAFAEAIEQSYPLADDLLSAIASYIIRGIPGPGQKERALLIQQKVESSTATILRENVMTLAEQFRQEGIQQGIQQGMQQGLQQGMQQGMQQGEAAILRHLFIRRFGKLTETYEAQLKQASTDQILAWCDKILDAKAPQDIFDN